MTKNTIECNISFPHAVFSAIESERGDVSRSRFVSLTLEKVLLKPAKSKTVEVTLEHLKRRRQQ